ncbi:MAG: hypothetical protein EHV01_004985 [Spiroplasma sp. hy2]|uniref:hypothetical protein n=1 Tax=Spiroplasma sp. hy2 TaxID=2490850 RepID=UPI0038416080
MKKIISILSTLSLTSTLTFPLIFCKQNKPLTYLDRDRTLITCNKNEKIGNIRIRYTTNDDPDTEKTNILLWCTGTPNIRELTEKVYDKAWDLFYVKFKKTMNLKTYGVEEWVAGLYPYSKEWDKIYPDNYFIN